MKSDENIHESRYVNVDKRPAKSLKQNLGKHGGKSLSVGMRSILSKYNNIAEQNEENKIRYYQKQCTTVIFFFVLGDVQIVGCKDM